MTHNTVLTRALFASVAAIVIGAPALAQTAPAEPAAADGEIVVTAQNRAQNVNDVPIAIDVITGETLKSSGFNGMDDIGKIAPVVQLNQDQGTVKVTIRGVGTNSNDEAQDTSVVVNIDGEYLNRPNALSMALFDMERVEVLRGPQGTLYGRNSTGGAINFITRKPGKDFGVNASASYGNYNAIRADAGVDVPLGGIGGIRVAGFYDKRDGYVSHPARAAFGPFPAFAGGSSDNNDAFGGRVSVQFDPTDRLSLNLAGEYAERKFTPGTFAYADLNAAGNGPTGPGCNALGFTRVAPTYPQTLCTPSGTNFLSAIDRGNYAAPAYGLGGIKQHTYAVRGSLAYEFSDAATLTYRGGYRSFTVDNQYLTLPVSYRSYNFLNQTDTQSHELRLNGEVSGIIYQIGGFYFKEKVAVESGFLIPVGPNGSYVSYFGRNISSDSKSAFGQVEVPIITDLTAVGGIRYTDNSRNAVYINLPFAFNSGPARRSFVGATPINLVNNENKVTWLAGLNYKPNSDTLIFGKVSTGFKGGGFDSVGVYKPESNTAYEAGWKQSFGERSQHQFNLGGYYYDYRDLQVSVLLNPSIGGQIFNAGKATIWGIEASADIELDRDNHFHATVNYLNSKYNDLRAQFNVYTVPGTGADLNGVGDLDPATPGVQQPNFAGNRPAFSPEWIITAGFDHVFRLGSAGSVTAKVDTTFKSSYFADFYNYRDGKQQAFTQTDLSLDYKPESGKFSIQAFVRNLENTRPVTYASFTSAGPDDIYNWQFGAPRTYGVRVGVDF